MRYLKPAKTFQEQIDILKDRGLLIDDEPNASDILQNISYYRLSAYFLPFQSAHNIFKEKTNFLDIVRLYEFDRHLRDMLWDAIESIEVSVRTQITYHFAHTYGPFGYAQSINFHPSFKHAEWLSDLQENVNNSHETFVKSFREKYSEEEHLPLWMATEVMSFGKLSKFFLGLHKKDKQAISDIKYKLNQSVLTSWLHTLVYVRNLCAHYSRIWNRTLSIKPIIPRKEKEWEGINNQKIFCILLILKSLMSMAEEWQEWKEKFIQLIDSAPFVNLYSMGFPVDWRILFDMNEIVENSPKVEPILE